MIIKVVIIEDETLAIQRLKRFLDETEDTFEVIAELKSVQDALGWFSQHSALSYDLIFSDIQLLDGLSFEIFEKIDSKVPIIFITAFDEYLLKAFKTYSIEYLLKPFSMKDLEKALTKFKEFFTQKSPPILDNIYTSLLQNLQTQHHFPTLLTYHKDKILMIKSEDVAYFSLDYQGVFAYLTSEKWLLSESLNQLQEKLPARQFYRANRQFIVQRKHIKEIEAYFGGRLKLILSLKSSDILISKDNVKNFKDWLQA